MARKSDYQTFIDKYKPHMETNGFDEEEGIKLYACRGGEWEGLAGDECQFLWTLLDCDGKLIIAPGFHYVNREEYIITTVPWDEKSRDYKY